MGPQGPAGIADGIQKVVYGTVPANVTEFSGRGYTGYIDTSVPPSCAYGTEEPIPCTFYRITFNQPFDDTPVCTATLYGGASFAGQSVSIVITGTNANSLGVETGTINREGLSALSFSFICVQ
jgi:hypothetical protein